jgi:hypothetical protein
MIVRELLTLLGFTVDQASYQKAQKAYDSLQGKLTQQQKAGQQANQALQQQGKAAAEAAKGAGMLGQALGMMQRFAAQAQISGLLQKFTQLASDANETRSALDQLFGKKGGGQVEQWAETAGAAMGRSRYDLQAYAARLGSVLGPMSKTPEEAQKMAQSFSELAVDLGSFFNTSDAEAMQSLRSGLTGEYESLKKYGIVLNDTTLQEVASQRGIKKKITQMSQVEKTELRYAAILARSKAAQCDATRTADGYANSTKALQAYLDDLGRDAAKLVIPRLERLVRWGKDAVKWFNKSAKGTHVLEAAMYTLAAVAGILAAEFYGAFVLPALAIGALILLVDDLWTTLEGGESITRDLIDGMFGEGTTAQVVSWIKATFGPLMAELDKLDARGIWETFSAGVDNAGFAMERLIEKTIRLLSWLNPAVAAFRGLKAAGQAAGILDDNSVEDNRAMGQGMNAPIAESISDELALRQRDQAAAIQAGVSARNARRAEKERQDKYGASSWNMEAMANRGPVVPYASGPAVYAPAAPAAAGGGGGGGAAAVNLAAPTIIINGGDTAAVKRVVTEAIEAERKKTAAALGGRGRS